MDVEIRSQSDPGTKAALTTKVQTIKKSFQTIRNDYQRANEREEQRALIGSPDRVKGKGILCRVLIGGQQKIPERPTCM